MPFWPFKKSEPERLSAVELRDKLISAAATGSQRKLLSACRQCKNQVLQHLDVIAKPPEGMQADNSAIDRYVQSLVAVAQCLANECGSPELWSRICGSPDDNPLLRWERWHRELPQRMERLEYDRLIEEANEFIEQAKKLRGTAARHHEASLHGRLGELLFHGGRVAEAVQPFESALDLCTETGDIDGQVVYLNNLIEVHRYLDDGLAVATAERLLQVQDLRAVPTDDLRKRIERLRKHEPLCRIVCVHDGKESELEDIADVGPARYELQFRRNRLSLQKATTLTELGNQLASSGDLSAALEKYHEASECDPHDPAPVYQSGMCLLELGAYAKGREAFEEVERLAPGWFRSRTDRWLAASLENGTVSDEELRLLRALDDGGLNAEQASNLVDQALERYPEFAPFYLIRGNLYRDRGKLEEAISSYRRGLENVQEPDLESRLLCALAASLPGRTPERAELVDRATKLKGGQVARATAQLLKQM